MKKLFTLYFIVLLGISVHAQPWFDAGIKGGIGTSFMYNSQIFDDQYLTHEFKPGYAFGAKLGFNFIQEHQLTFDVMKSSYTQGFVYYPEAGLEKHREFTIGSMDYLLMYRSNRKGTYFEIGPQMSVTSRVKYKDDGVNFIGAMPSDELINKINYSVAVGFGGYIFGTDNFGVTTGIRLNYTITDIASEKGSAINFPIFVDKEADPTHNLGIMFVVEMNYDFGYLVSPTCGERKKLFVF